MTYPDAFRWLRSSCDNQGVIIPIILWTLWCARNRKIFEDINLHLNHLVGQVSSLSQLVTKAFGDTTEASAIVRVPREVSWLGCPTEEFMALNVDGSARSNPGRAGLGGLVRNHAGSFLVGFYGSAGHTSVMHAEVLGLLNGLMVCWDAGYRMLVCYSDSAHAVELVKQGVAIHHPLANELAAIRNLLDRDWHCTITHTLRKGNQCADYLAKQGADSDGGLSVFYHPPPGMSHLLLADIFKVSFTRL